MAKTNGRRQKAEKPAKPWERTVAGRYRSSDGRFEIEQAEGRWFVRDESETDELGLPRTLGPFATLEAARDAAARNREAPPPVSPLAARIEESRKRPPAASRTARQRAERPSPPPAPPPPPPPPEPTWLDELDRDVATRARRTIAELERLGFTDAERIVRTDATTETPAVAEAVLARLVRAAAIAPWRDGVSGPAKKAPRDVREALRRLHDAGAQDADVTTIAGWIAGTAAVSALRPISELERDPSAPPDLPGWQLVERRHDARPGRRIRLDAEGLRPAHPSEPEEDGAS